MIKRNTKYFLSNNSREIKQALIVAGILICCVCCFFNRGFTQSLPLDDKAKYEKTLEMKVEEVLLRLLGPNQAKVVVQAVMDFTRTEKFEVQSAVAASTSDNTFFKWQNISNEVPSGDAYLMPGMPVITQSDPLARDNKSYKKQIIFPQTFLKKLTVTVVLNKTVSDIEAANVRNVVSELLGMQIKRGDELIIVKSSFAPIWKTIWYSPETMSLLFKYGVLFLMGIVGMIIVAIGFLKLAGAMSSMAKVQQSHQITMDLGKNGSSAGLGGEGIDEQPALDSMEKIGLTGPSGPEPGADFEQEEKIVFNVRPDQVIFLVNMLMKEDPSNIALVTEHLAPQVRGEFLKSLPTDISSAVIANMAKVRFVEPEVIDTLKEELERRLSGAVGGIEKILDVLEQVNLRNKKNMIEELQKTHPEIADEVRSRILMFEDLIRLSDRDLSMLVSAVKVDDWSAAAWEMSKNFKEKIKSQMADKTWQMVEQTMQYGAPSGEKIEKTVENIVDLAEKLIKEGKISNPKESNNQIVDESGDNSEEINSKVA